ncbi:MAG: FAD-dependent oxidoreductase [Acidobacteriota bacterium]|nr:MAG: FAD-dependent oxidoreductase [Acidobacteriota bacterium]
MASPLPLDYFGLLHRCEQCGTCSSACPLTDVDGFHIRRLLRHVELGFIDEIAATPMAWRCTVCARCETACPNGVPILDIVRRLRMMAPAEHVPQEPVPCVAACPARIDVPGYLRLIAQGEPTKAYALILDSAPFPGVLGRLCPRPCEPACLRAQVNQPVGICALKRYAADNAGALPADALAVEPDTGRKLAIIGAGPAGLTAAFYLRRKGHSVTVLEARSRAGGMMRYAIPRYRLPEDVLEREIHQVLSLGIALETNQALGVDFSLADLRDRGFEAVMLATGLQQSKRIDLEGTPHEDVSWGLDFLFAIGAGDEIEVKERVLIVGGGDVAVDAALSALRLGAREVTMACLESRDEMPAHPREIEQALAEGVRLMTSWGPRRVLADNGRVSGVDLVRCVSVFDPEGRFRPTFGDEQTTVSADQVILAIGQTSDLSVASDARSLRVRDGLIVADERSGKTDIGSVFAGGEIATGPGALIAAIAEGKKVAAAIDAQLGGDGVVERAGGERATNRLSDAYACYDGQRQRGFADRQRHEPPLLSVAERKQAFREVERALDAAAAIEEAKRCLQCDLERHPERLIRRQETGACSSSR